MDKNELIDIISDVGGDSFSAVVGAGLGTFVAGPVGTVGGAVAGSVVGNLFKLVAKEFREAKMPEHENKRVEKLLGIAEKNIEEKLKSGLSVKEEFFAHSTNNRSPAEEILEGVIFCAQKEYEEKKVEYLANLYANIPFSAEVSPVIAHALIKKAPELTYRQLQIISVIVLLDRLKSIGHSLALTDTYKSISGLENIGIATELYDLYQKSLVMSKSVIFDTVGIRPSDLSVGGYGALLYVLMELSRIEMDDNYKRIFTFLTGKNLILDGDKIIWN